MVCRIVVSVLVVSTLCLGGCKEEHPGNDDAGGAEAGITKCTSDKDCSGTKQVCNLLQKVCVDCLLDTHCGKDQHCVAFSCVSYTPCKNSLDCTSVKGKPICSKTLGECVACETDQDCDQDHECVKNTCVAYTPCKNSKDCTKQVCDTVKGKCMDCLTESDCEMNQDCVENRCKTYYPCKSDKDCTDKNMLCDQSLGRCKFCLVHSDCPAIYHCKNGDCVLDICAQTQSICINNGVARCNSVGDGYGTPSPCGKLKCFQSGLTARCDKWICSPPCTGITDTCDQGRCKCGSSPPCSGNSNTCTSGTCRCGSSPACIGSTDTCVAGACKCGIGAACTGATDTCQNGTCKCGSAPACSGNADTCDRGTCRCGTGPACTGTQVCIKGTCHTCTKDADCDDGLGCTLDKCSGGSCSSTVQSGNCLIDGRCVASGAINPINGCEVCDPTKSTSAWNQDACGTIVYVTTNSHNGNFGGRMGLDSFCKIYRPAGLVCTNFRALVSVQSGDAIADMPTNYGYKANRPLYWYNPTSAKFIKFSNSWTDALKGTIQVDRKTGTGVDKYVWTGADNTGGLANSSRYHCQGWTRTAYGQNWNLCNSRKGNVLSGMVAMPDETKNWLNTTSIMSKRKKYGPTTCCFLSPSLNCPSSCPPDSSTGNHSDVLMCDGTAPVMCACEP
jgi:hypothetical protein